MKKMLFLFLLFNNCVFGQHIELSVCDYDSISNEYNFDIIYEATSIYTYGDTVKYYPTDSIIYLEGLPFKRVPTRKNDGKLFHIFSEGSKGELYWLDTVENKVKTLIPSEEIEGYELKNVLGLDYKIAGYHVKVETPICKYKDAIMCLTKPYNYGDYNIGEVFYYVRGIGFVASEYRGIVESYITRRYILDKKRSK